MPANTRTVISLPNETSVFYRGVQLPTRNGTVASRNSNRWIKISGKAFDWERIHSNGALTVRKTDPLRHLRIKFSLWRIYRPELEEQYAGRGRVSYWTNPDNDRKYTMIHVPIFMTTESKKSEWNVYNFDGARDWKYLIDLIAETHVVYNEILNYTDMIIFHSVNERAAEVNMTDNSRSLYNPFDTSMFDGTITSPIISSNYLSYEITDTTIKTFNEVFKTNIDTSYWASNEIANSCLFNAVWEICERLNQKLNTDGTHKHTVITQEELATFLNVKYEKQSIGLTINQIIPFFHKNRIGLTILNVFEQVIYHYRPERRKRSINGPANLYLMLINNHAVVLNDNIKSLEQSIETKSLDPLCRLGRTSTNGLIEEFSGAFLKEGLPEQRIELSVSNKFSFRKKEKDDTVFYFMAEGLDDMIDQALKFITKNDIRITLLMKQENEKVKEDPYYKRKRVPKRFSLVFIYDCDMNKLYYNLMSKMHKQPFISGDLTGISKLTFTYNNSYNIVIEPTDKKSTKDMLITVPTVEAYHNFHAADDIFYHKLLRKEYISYFSEEIRAFEAAYPIGPVQGYTHKGYINSEFNAIDVNKAYTAAMLQVKNNPVCYEFDTYKQYDGHAIEDFTMYFIDTCDSITKISNKALAVAFSILAPTQRCRMFGYKLKKLTIDYKIISYRKPAKVLEVDFNEGVQEVMNNDKLSSVEKKAILNRNMGNLEKSKNKRSVIRAFATHAEAQCWQVYYGGEITELTEDAVPIMPDDWVDKHVKQTEDDDDSDDEDDIKCSAKYFEEKRKEYELENMSKPMNKLFDYEYIQGVANSNNQTKVANAMANEKNQIKVGCGVAPQKIKPLANLKNDTPIQKQASIYLLTLEKTAPLLESLKYMKEMIYNYNSMRIYDLYMKAIDNGIQVYCIKTDCLMVRESKEKLDPIFHFNTEIGGVKFEEAKRSIKCSLMQKKNINESNVKPYQTINKPETIILQDEYDTAAINESIKTLKNVLIKADIPGAGKTTIIKNMATEAEPILIITPYNNLAVDIMTEKRPGIKAITLQMLFGNYADNETKGFSVQDYNRLCFDEIYLHPISDLHKIYKYMQAHPSKQYFCTGDISQLESIENEEQINNISDYTTYKEDAMDIIFIRQIMLKKCKRAVAEQKALEKLKQDIFSCNMRDIIKVLRDNNIKIIDNIKDTAPRAITYFRHERDRVNAYIHKHIIQKPDDTINFQGTQYYKGLKVVCTHEFFKIGKQRVFKNYTYEIVDINTTTLTILEPLEEIRLEVKLNALKHFALPYAYTCHASQGLTIRENYTIYNANTPYVSPKWIWTAITRATSLSHVSVFNHPTEEVNRLSHNYRDQYFRLKCEGYKRQDKAKNRPFIEEKFITPEWFYAELKKCNTCTGCQEPFECNLNKDNSIRSNITADRKDNSKPHNIDNVRLLCTKCNCSKR